MNEKTFFAYNELNYKQRRFFVMRKGKRNISVFDNASVSIFC